MPQSSPLQVIRNLSVIPTGYTSQQLGALSAQVRLGAFFSAQVESERYLQGLRAMVAGAMEEGVTEGEFLHRVRAWLQMEADSLGLEAPSDRLERMSPEEVQSYERDVRRPDSLARLRLIFRTQAEMCAGLTEWRRGMEPMQLRLFPAWRFIRRPGAKTFRADHVEHEDEIHLKADLAWWMARNDPEFGGFGNPWPPFGFNSWMWIVPVSRAECERLGVLRPGQKVDLTEEERELWLNRIDKVLDTVGDLTRLPKPEPEPEPEPKPEPKPETAPKPEPETQGDVQDKTAERRMPPNMSDEVALLEWYGRSADLDEATRRIKMLVRNPAGCVFEKGTELEHVDLFAATIRYLQSKHSYFADIDALSCARGHRMGDGVGGFASYRTITLNNDHESGGVHGLMNRGWRLYDLEPYRKRLAELEVMREELAQAGQYTGIVDAEISELKESLRWTRHNVGVTAEGMPLQWLVTHEAGHVCHFMALGRVQRVKPRAKGIRRYVFDDAGEEAKSIMIDAYKRACKRRDDLTMDVHAVSEYAMKNEMEFCAECYAMRERGEALPDYVTDMLEKVEQIAHNRLKKEKS